MEAAILVNKVLKLPPAERAQVLEAILHSFDPANQASIDRAWLVESQERLAAFHAGSLSAEDGEATLRSIRDYLYRPPR